MSLRDELSRLLEKNSVTEITKELSVLCSQKANLAMEHGDDIYAERLEQTSNALWMIDYGV
ncbi:hypothetical protein EBR66_06435 [bacterium]|nr:hypothetical protein [bacterium]